MALMPLNCWNRNSMTPMRAARLDRTSPQDGSPAPPSLALAAAGGRGNGGREGQWWAGRQGRGVA